MTNLQEQIDLGHEGRYSHQELAASGLSKEEMAQATMVRLEGIRRRWLVEGEEPASRTLERAREDIAFQATLLEGHKQMFGVFVQRIQQAEFAAQRLQERVKRLEAEKAEKKIVAPNGREMRAVLASRDRR